MPNIAEQIETLNDTKQGLKAAITEMGVDVPAGTAFRQYPELIEQIVTAPTFDGLKRALKNGTAQSKYPVSTEIPDTYNGNNNPLIVAQYLDSTNNSSYDGAEGVILIRKYVEPVSQKFGTTIYYNQSIVKEFLETTYYDNSSEEIKSVISNINVICRTSNSSSVSIKSKWFLMGCSEVGGTYFPEEGIFWDFWKEKTGLLAASNTANPGRVATDINGKAYGWWLRSYGTNNPYVCLVSNNGTMTGGYAKYTDSYGILPACFIAKD